MSGVPVYTNRRTSLPAHTLMHIKVIIIRSKALRMDARVPITEWCRTFIPKQGESAMMPAICHLTGQSQPWSSFRCNFINNTDCDDWSGCSRRISAVWVSTPRSGDILIGQAVSHLLVLKFQCPHSHNLYSQQSDLIPHIACFVSFNFGSRKYLCRFGAPFITITYYNTIYYLGII